MEIFPSTLEDLHNIFVQINLIGKFTFPTVILTI